MAENRYQARGPQNRKSLITVRVTAEHRQLLHRLAAERGESLSRMLLAPWTDGKGGGSVKRSRVAAVAEPVVHEVPVEAEPIVVEVSVEKPPELPVKKRSHRARVSPDQVELVLGDRQEER